MNLQTSQTLKKIKSPSLMDLLKLHGVERKFDAYSINSHSFDKINFNELNDFIKQISDDYYKTTNTTPPQVNNDNFIELIQKDYISGIQAGKKVALPAITIQEGTTAYIKNDFSFLHVEEYLTTNQKRDKIEARLYLNLKPKNIVAFSKLFYDESRKQGLPTYFKFSTRNCGCMDLTSTNKSYGRNDNWLVYTSYNNLDKYVAIIKNIKQTRPELFEGTEKVSPNTGVLDGFIGYGEEPYKVENNQLIKEHGKSYSSRLGDMIDGIYEELASEINKGNYNKQDQRHLNSQEKQRLFVAVQKEFENSLSVILQSEPYNADGLEIKRIYDAMSLSQKQNFIQDITTQYSSVQPFGKYEYLVNNKKLNIVQFMNKFNVFYNYLGEDEINDIIKREAIKYNIDENAVCFNRSTKILVNQAMQTSSQGSQQNNANQTQQPQQNSPNQTQQQQTGATGTKQSGTNPSQNQTFTTATMGFRPVPKPSAPIPTMAYASRSLQDKINYLKTLKLEIKKSSDFASELNGQNGLKREDLSCAYAITQNGKSNVQDLSYKEIEKTLFEIVNFTDFNQAKNMSIEYMQVLNNAGYVPSYGTLARALQEMDNIENSNLDNKGARREFLRDALGKGNQMLADSMKISEYIKGQNNLSSPVTHEEQSKVLLKMQDNYNKFGLNPDSNKPKNFKKFIDPQTLPKPNNITLNAKSDTEMQADIDLHRAYKNYTYQPCPYTITDDKGEVQDIWNIQPSTLINNLAKTLTHGNANEIQKMRIICENMKGHFNPSYAEMAKFTKIINDFWKLGNDPNVDRAIESLKSIAQDKYNEAFQIAKFKAQNEGRPQATYGDMVNVFEELEKQQQLKKQAQQTSGGYGSGM